MKIGDLVHSIHDHTHRGIVMEVSVPTYSREWNYLTAFSHWTRN